MAKKKEHLARLRELAELLGREPDMSGSAADIAQRVAEMEEELGDTDDTTGQDTPLRPEDALTGDENDVVSAQPDTVIQDTAELVTVVALVTLHTDALHATRDEPVALALPGTEFRVSAGVAAEMTERGLARMQ
ncbi:DNA-packaging protein FI [Escherichia coli]|nr:DNA-packaging protein FI [Escherichia coli]